MGLLNTRILIADDLINIHEDFQKILASPVSSLSTVPGLAAFAPHLLVEEESRPQYQLTFVHQGDEALRTVEQAEQEGRPFAAVFLDVRMPPGIDGVDTAEQLLKRHAQLQVVLCTAYTDYSFAEISARFATYSNFLILKKPFDPAEVLQVAHLLTVRWDLGVRHQRLVAALRAALPSLASLAASDPAVAALVAQLDAR